MASTMIGRLAEFNPKIDSITLVERITLYFKTNKITEGKHVAVLLNAIGVKTYALLRNLITLDLQVVIY